MNILIIARGTPSKHDPQWGSFEFEQAKALIALGHKVIIASVDTRFRFYWRKIGLTTNNINGIKVYNLFICPGAIIGLLGSYILEQYNAYLWHRIARIIIQNEPPIDIIYPHYLINTHRAVHYLQDLHAPIVAIEHWSEVNQPTLRPAIKKMGNDVYPKVDRLLTVSHAASDSIKRHFGKESTVVYNMVDSSFLFAPRKKDKDRKFTCIAVGSLRPLKGYDTLIQALHKVEIARDKWQLLIIGNGTERKRLKLLISHYHLQQNVKLLGQKNKSEIKELLRQADAFVLTSRSETFGVVYIEAMACGLPVIATRCGGPEEFVNEKNGILVPVDDVEAITKAINYMYEHHQDYDRQAIADDCKARFSSEVIAKQLTEIFEEVVAKHKQL